MRKLKIVPYRNEELRQQDLLDFDDAQIVMDARIGIQILSEGFGGHLELWSGETKDGTFMVNKGADVPSLMAQVHNYINFIDIANA